MFYELETNINRGTENCHCYSQWSWGSYIAILKLTFFIMMIICPERLNAQTVILDNGHYRVIYFYHTNIPMYVTWRLDREDVTGTEKRGSLKFRVDRRLKPPRVTSDDFTNSGYQRGHMCPAADWAGDKEKMKATFLLTNITPQSAKLNYGQWKIDEGITRMFAQLYDSVLVECGSIFDGESHTIIGKHNIHVPDRFWKRVTKLANDSVLFFRFYDNSL